MLKDSLRNSPCPSYLKRGKLEENFPLTLTLSHQGRENYNNLHSYPQLYILTPVMGIALYDGKGSADIILM
jgi:hypothetical protein